MHSGWTLSSSNYFSKNSAYSTLSWYFWWNRSISERKRSAFISLRLKIDFREDWAWNLAHKVKFMRTGMTVLRLKSRSKNLFLKIDLRTYKMRLCIATSPDIWVSCSISAWDFDSTYFIKCGSKLTKKGSVEICWSISFIYGLRCDSNS